ncbi:hypothetical protein [Roseovarius sp. A-2]|uniref:hypothetical protein n=1 Tax=Roseovarius sp. A-2 TaxID=1570360 RepID=UPI00111AEFFE|nr:hypothetical protein [Roseovarius sp. A-2]
MTEKSPVTVISYISNRGALVRIDPQLMPVPFEEGQSFSAQIEVGCTAEKMTSYEFNFEFKKEASSATGRVSPKAAMGIIEGLTEGPATFEFFKIDNVLRTTAA